MKKYIQIFGVLVVCIFCITGVLAFDTFVQFIKTQSATDVGSNLSKIYVTNDTLLSYNNKDDDAVYLGDYLVGKYFDSALGYFTLNHSVQSYENVRIISALGPTQRANLCSGKEGYRLGGYSYSNNFGYMNFNLDVDTFVYLCLGSENLKNAYFGGYAYSKNFGMQNFEGITFQGDVVRDPDRKKIDASGINTSQDPREIEAGQFERDVRIIGDVVKSGLKKEVLNNAYSLIRKVSVNNGDKSVSTLGGNAWTNTSGVKLKNDTVLYYGGLGGGKVTLNGGVFTGNKTLLVVGGNLYITGNILSQSSDDILGILVAQDSEGNGGNVYIDPSVTDIHAIIFAEKSLISFNGTVELGGSTPDAEIANQLYIKGSIFSENTLGGGVIGSEKCPFFVQPSSCDIHEARKYDLNYIRRFFLTYKLDGNGAPTGEIVPAYDGQTSIGAKESNKGYSLIIDYNPVVAFSPPPLFSK